MEALEEPAVHCTIENAKVNSAGDMGPMLLPEEDLCHTSNGVAESSTTPLEAPNADYSVSSTVAENPEIPLEVTSEPQPDVFADASGTGAAVAVPDNVAVPDTVASIPPEEELSAFMDTTCGVDKLLAQNKSEDISTDVINSSEDIICNEITVEGSTIEIDTADTSGDKVTLRTEVLVEKNDDDIPDPNAMLTDGNDTANNILNEINQGIELNEALRASDTTDNGENNNGTEREEVFNKEELLDILEGNDDMSSGISVADKLLASDPQIKKKLETQIALNQLSRLRQTRNKRSSPKKKKGSKTETNTTESKSSEITNSSNTEENNTSERVTDSESNSNDKGKNKNESIVNTLVKDWDDDEPTEVDQSKQLLEETDSLLETTDSLVKSQESVTSHNSTTKTAEMASDQTQSSTQIKTEDEHQPQRRLGRVIKKKVIFDPDNPDTFTKGKMVSKNKDSNVEKEQPPPKKTKAEQSPQRAKSKSPTGKMQWKKPTPKSNSKQNKRLTEVDKLLMDEGAVNMIYQLTPEAPKGKKNMRTKAEFIKKIQSSSTPDSKEMKFRERKKEARLEEGDAKKLGGKQRSSLSSSVKSPLADDFETHSADDSIIYRRHSSSSYSSACMSPRRLSDVETGSSRSVAAPVTDEQNHKFEESIDKVTDIFMADTSNVASNEIINKDDCLSLKEKLNTKLSLALNKRKRETPKTEKPLKQKRVAKNVAGEKDSSIANVNYVGIYKYVSVSFDQRLAEICVSKLGSEHSVQMLKELENALSFIDSRNDVSVTLITSECGTLCSEFNMKPLLGDKMEVRTNYAHEIAEAIRSLLWAVERHNKLVVAGAWGACSGVALALLALSDVALAAERASFALRAPPAPGIAALTSRCSRLSQTLINDLVVFGRELSAAEAVQGGLVSRALPGAGGGIVRAVAKDLASQPMQSILLKKQLLNLKKTSDSDSTFLSGLERERDLLVEYWTSVEGQEVLRTTLNQ